MVKRMGKRVLAEGRHLRFVEENGWEFAERFRISGIVVLIPVTPEGKLVLVEQFRVPVGANVIELPAGLAGDVPQFAGESLETAANRELEEETGYRAETLRLMMHGPPSAALSAEIMHVFLATDLVKVGSGGGDISENITVHEIPFTQISLWLAQQATQPGKLIDPKVYMGSWFAREAFSGQNQR